MKKHLWELGKSLLILVLCCTLLLLTLAAMPAETIRTTPWLSAAVQPFAPLLGLPRAELAYVEEEQPVSDAAQPLMISVQNSGGRYTTQWDFGALDAAYETLGGMLGEALDTAGEFAAVPADSLQQALSGIGVCFDYQFALSAQLLASWLEAVPREHAPDGSMYVLAVEEDVVALYLAGETCWRSVTRVQPDALLPLLETFHPNGARFAFEDGSHLAPLAVIRSGKPTIRTGTVLSPCDNRYMENLATELGFNPYDETSYTDSSGVSYFSEANCSLQIGTDGRVLLTSTSNERFQAPDSSMEILVEEARAMVELAVGETLGDGRIYLSGVTVSDEKTVCTFDYVLGGVPVSCGEESAAVVTFRGRALTEFAVQAYRFSLGTEVLKVLPPTQAMAILPEGSDLALEYHCAGAGSLAAGWKKG